MTFKYSRLINTRKDFGSYLNEQNLLGTAVEVGVHRGDFSHQFLSQWRGSQYILVDPWAKTPGYTEHKEDDWGQAFRDVVSRFKSDQRVAIVRETSNTAATIVGNGLDFVYIDANHIRSFVLNDALLWWPKIRRSGILAFHDLFSLTHIGVTNAIVDFLSREHVTAEVVPPCLNSDGKIVSAGSCFVVKE